MVKKLDELYEKLEEWEQELVRWIRKTRPTIYTILQHVSQSGTSRVINCYLIRDNKPVWLSPLIAKVTSYKIDRKRDGIRISGTGMNMGFALVSDFSSVVFPTGFRYRKGERHRNDDPTPIDKNGEFALRQEWL